MTRLPERDACTQRAGASSVVNIEAARVAGMQAHLFENNEQTLARIATHLGKLDGSRLKLGAPYAL